MKLLIQAAVLTVLSVSTTSANGDDEQHSLITVESPKAQSGKSLLEQWRKLPDNVRKKIELEVISGKRLGISSTGAVKLMGVYDQPLGGESDGKSHRLFHLRQTDLHPFRSRLFWSILVNPDQETFRILFHINEVDRKNSPWIKLRMENPSVE